MPDTTQSEAAALMGCMIMFPLCCGIALAAFVFTGLQFGWAYAWALLTVELCLLTWWMWRAANRAYRAMVDRENGLEQAQKPQPPPGPRIVH